MADLLDKLKTSVTKGLTTASVKSREIFEVNRVNGQIADLERQKKEALAELGASVCTMLDSGALDEEGLKNARIALARFDEQITVKKQELETIHTEAQRALSAAQPTTQPPPPAGTAAFCQQCGVALTSGAKFCPACGKAV